jgi:hypothetical protein
MVIRVKGIAQDKNSLHGSEEKNFLPFFHYMERRGFTDRKASGFCI